MPDPTDIYQSLRSLVHHLQPSPTVARDGDKGCDFVCQTYAAQVSAPDPNDKTKNPKNLIYVLLSHYISFDPANNCSIEHYGVEIKPIDLKTERTVKQETWMTKAPDLTVYDALDGAVLISHLPVETPTLENYSNSTSWSFGANIGFFGDIPTGGLSGSYTMTDSHSWSTPSVSVTDRSDSHTVRLTFNMNTDAQRRAPFQTYVSALWQLPDEKFGDTRSLKEDGAKVGFSIVLTAPFPKEQLDERSSKQITLSTGAQVIMIAAPPKPLAPKT